MLTATLSLLLFAAPEEGSRAVFLEVEAAMKDKSLTKKSFADCTQEFSSFET